MAMSPYSNSRFEPYDNNQLWVVHIYHSDDLGDALSPRLVPYLGISQGKGVAYIPSLVP